MVLKMSHKLEVGPLDCDGGKEGMNRWYKLHIKRHTLLVAIQDFGAKN